MFDSAGTWNISFAGCGFSSIYYLGALSCVLQRLPRLVHGAARICGASSGCLVAAALTVGVPIGELTVGRRPTRRLAVAVVRSRTCDRGKVVRSSKLREERP